MYREITESDFIHTLCQADSTFSYQGARALFAYLEETGYGSVDYVGLCCEYVEATLEQIGNDYDLVDREDYLISDADETPEYDDDAYASAIVAALKNKTTVFAVKNENYPTLDSVYVYANF